MKRGGKKVKFGQFFKDSERLSEIRGKSETEGNASLPFGD